MSETKKGWGFPWKTMKAHYFDDVEMTTRGMNGKWMTSMCGKELFAGVLFDGMHDDSENCKECMKKRNEKYEAVAKGR